MPTTLRAACNCASRHRCFRTRHTRRSSMSLTRRMTISIMAAGSILMAVASTASAEPAFSDVFQENCRTSGGTFTVFGTNGYLVCIYDDEYVYCPNSWGPGGPGCGVHFN